MVEIQENGMKQLIGIPKEDFADYLVKLMGCWDKCIRFQKEYFEEV